MRHGKNHYVYGQFQQQTVKLPEGTQLHQLCDVEISPQLLNEFVLFLWTKHGPAGGVPGTADAQEASMGDHNSWMVYFMENPVTIYG